MGAAYGDAVGVVDDLRKHFAAVANAHLRGLSPRGGKLRVGLRHGGCDD